MGGPVGLMLVLPLCPARDGDDSPPNSSTEESLIPLSSVTSFAARNRTPAEVERRLGPPNYRLSPELWVYWDCESSVRSDVTRGFNAMILRFTDGHVTGLRLARRSDVEKLIAQLEATKRRASRLPSAHSD